jgi:hypothetical protein
MMHVEAHSLCLEGQSQSETFGSLKRGDRNEVRKDEGGIEMVSRME